MGLMDELKKNIKGKAADLNKRLEETFEAVDERAELLKKLTSEEKKKLNQLGIEAYIEDLKTNKEVYGEISERVITKTRNLYAQVKDLEENSVATQVCKGTIYGLGAHYRNKMLKNKEDTGGK